MEAKSETRNLVFIYTLSDPETGEVRYVGKTNCLSGRLYSHLKDTSKSKKTSWVKSLVSRGLKPIIEEIETLQDPTDEQWGEAERFWIETLRFLGSRLTNIEKGGDGIGRMTPEISARMSAGQKRRAAAGNFKYGDKIREAFSKFSPEKKAEIAERKRRSMLGKNRRPCSEERKKRISKAYKGVKWSQERLSSFRARLAETYALKKKSGWSYPKGLSSGMKGRTHTEDARKRISKARKGHVKTPEERAKRSNSLRNFYKNKSLKQKENT